MAVESAAAAVGPPVESGDGRLRNCVSRARGDDTRNGIDQESL
jgi:hypothetical protein